MERLKITVKEYLAPEAKRLEVRTNDTLADIIRLKHFRTGWGGVVEGGGKIIIKWHNGINWNMEASRVIESVSRPRFYRPFFLHRRCKARYAEQTL